MTVRVYAGGPPEQRALEAWRIVSGGAHQFVRRVWGELLRLQDRRCFLCGEPLDLTHAQRSTNPNGWTWEHVFPRGVGGGERSNVLLAHRCCNTTKGNRWPYPCEVIYLFAAYAQPYNAPLMRLAKAAHALARAQRRRFAIDKAHV